MTDGASTIRSLRISNALLRGKVKTAEALALTDEHRQIIADWKVKWAGMPHGEWSGKDD